MQENPHKRHLQGYMKKHRINPKEELSSASKARNEIQKPMKRVGPTNSKTASKSPNVSMRGKFSINDILTEDELQYIFTFLSASDLLRVVPVCKLWMALLTKSDLWRVAFRKLPKKVQALSENAKKPKEINWKEELIYSCKKFRKVTAEKLLLKKVNGLPAKVEEAIRYLDATWLLLAEDRDHNDYTVTTKEVFFFASSFSIRWDQLDLPNLSKIAKLKLFALVPVFKSGKGTTSPGSVCTKSLIEEYQCARKFSKDSDGYPGKDDQVRLQFLKNLVIGTWNVSETCDNEDVAFITCSFNYHNNLVERILCGNSTGQYDRPKHIPYEDDIDRSYGLHGYSGTVCIRNNRKTLWEVHYREFFEYVWHDDMFLISKTREDDYSYYEIDKEYEFVWTAGAMKGKVKNSCIVDFTFMDQNHQVMWSVSRPAFVTALDKEKSEVSYYYEDGEILTVQIKDDSQKVLTITLVKQRDTSRSTVVKVEIGIPKQFINSWFATQY